MPMAWDEEREERAARLHNWGMTAAEVGAAMGCTARAVEQKLSGLRRSGRDVVNRRGGWTAGEEATVAAMPRAGDLHARIAAVLGKTAGAVADRLTRLRMSGDVDGGADDAEIRVPAHDPLLAALMRHHA